jgi:hypothetical protein
MPINRVTIYYLWTLLWMEQLLLRNQMKWPKAIWLYNNNNKINRRGTYSFTLILKCNSNLMSLLNPRKSWRRKYSSTKNRVLICASRIRVNCIISSRNLLGLNFTTQKRHNQFLRKTTTLILSSMLNIFLLDKSFIIWSAPPADWHLCHPGHVRARVYALLIMFVWHQFNIFGSAYL